MEYKGGFLKAEAIHPFLYEVFGSLKRMQNLERRARKGGDRKKENCEGSKIAPDSDSFVGTYGNKEGGVCGFVPAVG